MIGKRIDWETCQSVFRKEVTGMVKMGFGKVTVNPAVSSCRFGPGDRKMTKTEDDLTYRIFILQNEGEPLYVNISCPLADTGIEIRNRMKAEIEQQLGCLIALTLASTHTHYSININKDSSYWKTAADALADEIKSIKVREYEDLYGSFVWRRFDQVGKCRVSGEHADVYFETYCLYEKEKRIATFIIYNSHPTTLNFFEDYFSAVGPGILLHQLEEEYPDEFFTYFIGAAGDVSTRFTRREQTYSEVKRLTAIVKTEAEEQLHMDRGKKKISHIRFKEEMVPMTRRYLDISHLELPPNISQREKDVIHQAEGMDRKIPTDQMPKEVLFQRLKFDDYTVIFTPFELFSEYISSIDKDHASLVNCANDHVCYLSGLHTKYLSFELFGESIGEESKLQLVKLLKQWSSPVQHSILPDQK